MLLISFAVSSFVSRVPYQGNAPTNKVTRNRTKSAHETIAGFQFLVTSPLLAQNTQARRREVIKFLLQGQANSMFEEEKNGARHKRDF